MAEDARWRAHPVLATLLRLGALLVPVAVGVVVALLLVGALPDAGSVPARVLWWATVLGGSVAATFAADRLARRVLPLAVLLELSLIFPDRAPSRLRAIRASSVRDLDQRLARLRGQGVPMEPYETAETLVTLVGILGLHDKRTRGHSERVRALTDLLTDQLGLDEHDRVRLRWAALVHDLGKLTVPVTVLNGGADLDDQDWDRLRQHPDEGLRLVNGLLPWLEPWGDAVGQHHERWDGQGYPAGLEGEQISYAARLVAVCDSFETMTSARSYKPARSAAEGRRELARCSGSQFDPAVVRAFLAVSLGRLTWVLGPVTWLAQVPFVAAADRAGQAVKAGAVAVGVTGLIALGAAPGPAAVQRVSPAGVASDEGLSPVRGETGAGAGGALPVVVAASPPTEAPAVQEAVAASTDPSVAPDPSLTPDPSAVPTPDPSLTPDPSAVPTPSTSPSPSTSASPSPEPVALQLTAFLAPGTLVGGPPEPSTTTVLRGGALVFDRPVDSPLTITGDPRALLRLDFQDRTGGARLTVRVLDCDASGTACAVLADAEVRQDRATTSGGTFVTYDVTVPRTAATPQVVEAGRLLRLELALSANGAKADLLVRLGAGAGEADPSRLVVPATVLLAQGSATPVAPSVLLVVLVLLGLSALRPARPSPLRPGRPRSVGGPDRRR